MVGSFTAVCYEKYEDFTPQIGKVKSFDESFVILEYLLNIRVPGNTEIK